MKFVVNNFESIPKFINAIMHLQTMQDSPRLFYVVYWYTCCIVHVYMATTRFYSVKSTNFIVNLPKKS